MARTCFYSLSTATWGMTFGLMLSGAALASVTYITKKGDKLSKIAGKAIPGPVWGKKGSLQSVLALNREITHPDLIYPGQIINLPLAEMLQGDADPGAIQGKRAPASEMSESPLSTPSTAPPKTPEAAKATDPFTETLELAPYYALTSISAKDSATGGPASIASSANAGLDLRYYQPWSDRFRTFVHLQLGMLSFEQPTDSSESLDSSSKFMSGIGLGTDFKFSPALTFRVFGDYKKEAFVKGISTNTADVDAVSIPQAGAKLSADLLQSAGLKFGISGEYSELFQTSTGGYTVQQGNLYGGSIYCYQDMGSSIFQTELGYISRQQNTDITNQTERDFVLRLRWLLPFGKAPEATH